MNTPNTMLGALTRAGVLIAVTVRYWRARKKLNAEDLGLSRSQIDADLFSLGHKRLVPKQALQRLSLIESRAHALVEESSFPFLNGVARYLPNSRLEEVHSKLRVLQDEYNAERSRFFRDYCELREQALQHWQQAAADLVDDPSRLVATIRQAFPASDDLDRYFGFHIRLFQVAVPDVPEMDLIGIEDQRAIIEARNAAARNARLEIEGSCRSFIADCVATMREQTAALVDEMLESMSSGYVHQKTLNRLSKFIDRFSALNFADDKDMEVQLDRVRKEFLTRSAGEYRDTETARQHLVTGLENLRDHARGLASREATELVEGFGQLGRRRFALAS
jgi:hypothetical protein